MKGRKPKPRHLRVVDNGADHGRNDAAQSSHLEAAIPSCPRVLGKEARREWKRVTAWLKRAGLVTHLDRGMLAAYCQAFGRWEQAEAKLKTVEDLVVKTPNGYQTYSVYLTIANKALDQVRQFGAEFGMSPSSRARAERSLQGDLFDDFENEFIRG